METLHLHFEYLLKIKNLQHEQYFLFYLESAKFIHVESVQEAQQTHGQGKQKQRSPTSHKLKRSPEEELGCERGSHVKCN